MKKHLFVLLMSILPSMFAFSQERDTVPLDSPPTFMYGNFKSWVQKNVRYPQLSRQNGGRVIYTMEISPEGVLENIKIISSPDEALSEAVIETLLSSPKWKPGVLKGKFVRVAFQGYVDFVAVQNSPEDKKRETRLARRKEPNKEAGYSVAPRFITGQIINFEEYLRLAVKYPRALIKNKTAGTVRANFDVDEKGEVSNLKLTESLDERLDENLMKTIPGAPRWILKASVDTPCDMVTMTVIVDFYPDGKRGVVMAQLMPLSEYKESKPK